MNSIDKKRLSQALTNGAEYLAMGEIAAHTGLLVSLAPRNNANFDIIVNSHDLKKGCRVEVKHSRTGFKANIKGDDFDFLIFIYAPSMIENDRITPTATREIYVFPKKEVLETPSGKTGVNFNPKYIEDYKDYLNAFYLIDDHINT